MPTLSIIQLKTSLPCIIKLNVTYAECRILAYFAERQCAECRGTRINTLNSLGLFVNYKKVYSTGPWGRIYNTVKKVL
jgi:hypothetical protein